ncbi:unnamed protein product, partial [Cuscuta epithymum]
MEEDTTSVTGDVLILPHPDECVSAMRCSSDVVPSKHTAASSSTPGVRKALNPAELLNLTSKKKRMIPPLPLVLNASVEATHPSPALSVPSLNAGLPKPTALVIDSATNVPHMKDEMSRLLLPVALDA